MLFLTAFQCEEEVYEPDAVVENENLIRIDDDKTVFSIGEFISIRTEISNRQFTVENREVKLSDYLLTENEALFFALGLFRIDENNERFPVVIQTVATDEGSIQFSDQNAFFTIESPLNPSNDRFTSRIQIKLEEAGTYLLLPETARFPDDEHFVLFDLYGLTEVGSLQLNTSIMNADQDGIYRFTVE